MVLKYFLTAISFTLALSTPIAGMGETCWQGESDQFGAEYIQSGPNKETILRWNFWRNKQQIAHEYPDKSYSEVWHFSQQNLQSFERRFGDHKRALVYTPSDIKLLSLPDRWNDISSIVGLSGLKKARKNSTYQCLIVEHYSVYKDDLSIEIDYLPTLKLPLTVSYKRKHHSTTLRLATLSSSAASQSFFSAIDDYQTTDYADIGDNESDPFLNRLVNIGFVEKGRQEPRIHYPGHKH